MILHVICFHRLIHVVDLFAFQGYSYVAPSIIFSDNTVSNDLLKIDNSNQPLDIHIRYASHFKVRTILGSNSEI